MFLKDLVLKEGNKYYLLDGPGGQPKVNRRGRRLPAITLSTAVRDANLEDNEEDLAGASEFISGVLVQRRNDVLHGRDVGYAKAKLSVQALLVLAVLAEGFEELEEGYGSQGSAGTELRGAPVRSRLAPEMPSGFLLGRGHCHRDGRPDGADDVAEAVLVGEEDLDGTGLRVLPYPPVRVHAAANPDRLGPPCRARHVPIIRPTGNPPSVRTAS